MSARVILLALVALVSAAGTTMMARNWAAAQRVATAPAVKAPPLPEVIVATAALPAGMVVKAEHLAWQPWPKESVREGYFVKDQADMLEVIGSVVRSGIAPGEPILDGRIVRPGDRGFLAAMLTPGMRAVAVPVNAPSGIAGLIFPGDRVDVILTHTLNGEGGEAEKERVRRASETVLENIRVLATDQRTDHEEGSSANVAKTATLEVTPKQAEILSMVTELGRLSLSLRSLQLDDEAAEIGESAPAGAEAARPSGQSYTLDSNVSVLLDAPAVPGKPGTGKPRPERKVDVVRGKDATQLTF